MCTSIDSLAAPEANVDGWGSFTHIDHKNQDAFPNADLPDNIGPSHIADTSIADIDVFSTLGYDVGRGYGTK